MRNRCKKIKKYRKNYWDRGIRICKRWKCSKTFIKDMGPRPSPKHSLDRINNDKGYSPSNCRWATKREQRMNIRNNIYLTVGGRRLHIEEWAKKTGIKVNTIKTRKWRGWTDERALTQAVQFRP